MDQDKPFKTIEVIDIRTNQPCKIACMSCIRGHRTTSCGIPVCRQKVFWTVKRPGRPSNSCTCRYNSAGGCKCATAMSKCPHKVKKGEKRSNECRCDEQGRFCCLLEAEHWEALMRLEKPGVTFFPVREALEAAQYATRPVTPGTPSHFSLGTPATLISMPGTPIDRTRQPSLLRDVTALYDPMMSPHATLTPRFGFMGIGAPMGLPEARPLDPWTLNRKAPVAPRQYSAPSQYQLPQTEPASTCQSSAPPAQPELQTQAGSCCQPSSTNLDDDHDMAEANSCCQGPRNDFPSTDTFPELGTLDPFLNPTTRSSFDAMYTTPVFDFDRWMQDYQAYQMPGAICQKCGLNGCTCRNCPPVMQNHSTTSWAQGCNRAHARIMQPQSIPRTQAQPLQPNPQSMAPLPPLSQPDYQLCAPPAFAFSAPHDFNIDPRMLSPQPLQEHMDGLENSFAIPNVSDPLQFSDFLMSELDRPSHTPGEDSFGG